jgi:probable rRNA maturation factor
MEDAAEIGAIDIAIDVDPPYAEEVDAALLQKVARTVLAREGRHGPLTVGLWITNEDELRNLNRTFRDVDATTDVLSFGDTAEDLPFIQDPEDGHHLGDIAISFPHVVRQAEEYGHSQARELAYLLTHGILHLLGYDHEDPEDARDMRAHEEAALKELQITREPGNAGADA